MREAFLWLDWFSVPQIYSEGNIEEPSLTTPQRMHLQNVCSICLETPGAVSHQVFRYKELTAGGSSLVLDHFFMAAS